MIKQQSNEISIKRSKLQHQAELLESYFDASTMLCQSGIAGRKRKIALQLSICLGKQETGPNNKIQFLSFESSLSEGDI